MRTVTGEGRRIGVVKSTTTLYKPAVSSFTKRTPSSAFTQNRSSGEGITPAAPSHSSRGLDASRLTAWLGAKGGAYE